MSFYHWFPSHPNECEFNGGVDRLHDIGQELRVSAANTEQRPPQIDFQRISSVPDVWSQHRLFDMLLLNRALDPGYLEYEAIAVREWRAMLAIVVLAESYGIELHVQTTDLNAKKAQSPFIGAAFGVCPGGKSWDSMDIYYVEKDGRRYPIAMTSPTVHLVPAKDAWQSLNFVYPGRIPWLAADMVHAPVVQRGKSCAPFMLGAQEAERFPAMLPVHALMLKEWLSYYRARAEETQDKDLLEAYETALNTAYRLDGENIPSVAGFFAAPGQPVGAALNGVRLPEKLQIFLDRVFYSCIEQKSRLSTIPDTHRFAGGISQQSIFSQSTTNGEYAHFFVPMPVTETFWQLWQDNLACRPTYEVDCELPEKSEKLTKIKVTVNLGDIRFSKTYSEQELDSDFWRNLCTAGIWPHQKIANWDDYFLFCFEANGYRAEPLKKQPVYRETTYEKRDGVEGTVTYFKLSYAPDCCMLLKDRQPIGYFLIRDRRAVPRGIEDRVYRASLDFGTSSTTLYGGVEGGESKLISGMNFWSLPLINNMDATSVEYSRLERYFLPPLPAPIARAGEKKITAQLDGASFADLLERPELASFYPSSIPMQSVLADAVSTVGARSYLKDSWIYFRNFAAMRETEEWPKICSDLKWAHAEPLDLHRIRAILAQILVMLALEARCQRCGKISVTASYPLSFENTTRDTYFQALEAMLTVIGGVTGLTILPPGNNAKANEPAQANVPALLDSITESEAVFRFAVGQNTLSENQFVVDIGGGSTDIFISLLDGAQRRRSYATSLGFGARKVLIEKLCHNKNELLLSLMDQAVNGIDKIIRNRNKYITDQNAKNRNSMIEDMFMIRVPVDADSPAAALVPDTFGDAYLDYSAGEKQDGPILELKKRIAFYLGASVWLSGMMLRGDQNKNISVSMLFAGNGSKMIGWLDPELDRTRYFAYRMFQTSAGIPIDWEKFGCRFSAMPKEEVALGALLELPDEYCDETKAAAKQVFFDRKAEQDDKIETFHTLRYGRKDIKTDRPEFEKFLNAFRESAKASYEWDFSEKEYGAAILEGRGIQNSIRNKQDRHGYFLSALEVTAAQFLGKVKNTQMK